MSKIQEPPEKTVLDELVKHGVWLLEVFHEEYSKDPVSCDTEYRRGHVAEWRHLMDLLYGPRTTEQIVGLASDQAGLTVPHAGQMSEDGEGYLGFDSGAHMYIGKLPDGVR